MSNFYLLSIKEAFKKSPGKYILILILILYTPKLFSQPVINSFTPDSRPLGSAVTINGSNFSANMNNNIVYFGGVRATITSGSGSSLKVIVPTGATYQPISVITNGLTAYSTQPFNVTFKGGGVITATSFAPKLDYSLKNSSQENFQTNGIQTSDLDGDGKLDMIYGCFYSLKFLRNTTVNSEMSFSSPTNIAVSYVAGFAVADLDGDGKPDLITLDLSNVAVSVFKNISTIGSISFAGKVDFPTTVGGHPYRVVIGNLDGDGKPDMAIANVEGTTISVFKNQSVGGIISFAPKVEYTTNGNARSLTLGDFNSDGKADIAIANQRTRSISVFRNTSAGEIISFATRIDYLTTAGGQPENIVTADFDGDGKLDISVSNSNNPGTISVFKNTSLNGVVSFAAKSDYHTGNDKNPYSLSVADFDGDGKPDMAVANLISPTITVLRNESTAGTISFSSKIDYNTGANDRQYLVVGDFNGDAKPDLATAIQDFTEVSSFLINKVDGPNITSFSPIAAGTGEYVTIKGTNFTGAAAVGFGGQGSAGFLIIDSTTISALVGAGSSGDVTVGARLGTGRLSGFTFTGSPKPIPTITGFTPASGTIGTTVTIDGTNFGATTANNFVYFGAVRASILSATPKSLAVSVPNGNTYKPITVTTNNLTAYAAKPFKVTSPGMGLLTASSFATKINYGTASSPSSVCLNDFDTDGKPDIVITNLSLNTVSVFRNQGMGELISFEAKQDFATASQPINVSVGDLDGDGKNEIAVANAGSNSVSVLRNTSTFRTISFAAKFDFPTGNSPRGIAIRDMDGDGKSDLIVFNYSSNTISVSRNTSSGTGVISFAAKQDYPTGNNPFGISIADFNNDGKPDVAVINLSSNTISILSNTSTTGNISYAPKIDFPTGTLPYSISTGDFDGDGSTDIAIASQSPATVSVLRNTGNTSAISFAAKVDYPAETNVGSVFIDDFDRDGKLDILVGNGNIAGSVSVFTNVGTNGAIAFAGKVDYAAGAGPCSTFAGDINEDGKPEILVVNGNDNNISILKNEIIKALLPLTLLHFSGTENEGKVRLLWKTTSEQNTAKFVIEFSKDGVDFSSIGSLPAAGQTTQEKTYEFFDVDAKPGVNYYRLKMIDIDGKFTYSSIIRVVLGQKQTKLVLYPNPAREHVIVKHPGSADYSQLKVIDLNGSLVKMIKLNKGFFESKIYVGDLAPGVYKIIWSSEGTILSETLVVKEM